LFGYAETKPEHKSVGISIAPFLPRTPAQTLGTDDRSIKMKSLFVTIGLMTFTKARGTIGVWFGILVWVNGWFFAGMRNDALLRLTHPTLYFLAVFGFDRPPPLHGCALPHSGL
jgi:hypothetical protein